MAMPLSEKLVRMLRFLVAVRNPRIMAILSKRGFSTQVLKEGWELFLLAAGSRMSCTGQGKDAAISDEVRRLVAELDDWDNSWFPVVSASLIDKIRRANEAEMPRVDLSGKKEQEKAASDAWAWYREWSQISRTLITRGGLRIQMGLKRVGRRAADEEEDEAEEPAMAATTQTSTTASQEHEQ